MRPVTVTTSGVSTSNPVVLDYINTAFDVAMQFIVTGAATYTVQYTMDDPYAAAGLVNWFSHDISNLVAATTSQTGNYSAPIRASRINQTAGAGSVSGTYVQGLK